MKEEDKKDNTIEDSTEEISDQSVDDSQSEKEKSDIESESVEKEGSKEAEEDSVETAQEDSIEEKSDIESESVEKEESKETKEEDNVFIPESANFLIGRKIGMTRIFDDSGYNHPVTIINVNPNIVTQVKSNKIDGYSAIQIGMSNDKKLNNYNKADKGKFDKLGLEYKNHLKEFKVSDSEIEDYSVGLTLSVDVFNHGDNVNVTGISRGKGFTGHMKRHGFHGGRRSHGKNSVMRKAGSVGASADPARIWPGKKMAGRSGGKDNTALNLTIVRVDSENNNLYIRGAVSGAKNGIVYIEG